MQKKMRRTLTRAVLVPFLVVLVTLPAWAADQDRLLKELKRLAKLGGGTVGVGAKHLESGEEVFLNGDVSFPMASTYKVPIAVQLLRRVDLGQVDLGELVELKVRDLHPGSGTISRLLDDPGVALSLRNLLELTMLISDNSATDLVLKAAGGPAEVNRRLAELGVEGVRVDRPTLNLIADWLGIEKLPPEAEWSPQEFAGLYRDIPPEKRKAAAEAFTNDPRDTSTPLGMLRLLEKVWSGQALSDRSTELIIDIMSRCETGENRIRGLLPPDTAVAHKTGTIGGSTNDVGVVTLPEKAGRVVLAVFVKGSDLPVPERERAIAQISRAVYDYFLFHTPQE